jgi:endoglucanase
MKRIVLFVILCLVLSGSTVAQSRFVHTQGKQLVDASGSKLILRGTNLGNWMVPEGYMFQFKGGPQSAREIETLITQLVGPEQASKFWHEYREQYVTKRDIEYLKSIGFNSIRVPIHYKFFLPGNSEGFALLDRVVEWSHQAGLYVIIDMHCAPGGQTGANIDDSWGYPWLFEDAQSQAETIDIWKRIAAHYRDNPTVLGYDLLNEPIPHFPELAKYNSALEPLYRRITAAVREVDPNHVIILGGAQWDGNFKVFGTPFDKNVMYTFHKYWTAPTQEVIQQYLDFRDGYNVPVWMGESGENTDEWIGKFVKVLEDNEVSWTFWPYKKMDATSSIVSFARPVNWDAVVMFAKLPQASGDSEKLIAARPSIEASNQALADLLQKIRFSECRPNPGYIQALGMKVPQHN